VFCAENVCTCANGLSWTGEFCEVNASEKCSYCNRGYHLEGDLCVENSCSCTNGVAVNSTMCFNHLDSSCESCITDYNLVLDSQTGTYFCAHDSSPEMLCLGREMNLIWVVDGSGSVGVPNFEASKAFVKQITGWMDAGATTTEISFVQFSSYPYTEFKFESDADDISDLIDHIRYISSGTAPATLSTM
jgi:hypothetical protein